VAYFTYLLTRLGDDTQTLMVFKNGVLSRLWLLKGDVGSVTFSDVPEVKDWYRVEMHGKPSVSGLQILLYGRMTALTNPIYFGFWFSELALTYSTKAVTDCTSRATDLSTGGPGKTLKAASAVKFGESKYLGT
jgi:hypothetical protein